MSFLYKMFQLSMYLASEHCRIDIGGSTEVQTFEPYLGSVKAEFTIDKHCELAFYLFVDERWMKFDNNGWPYPANGVPKIDEHSCSISANYDFYGGRNHFCYYFTGNPYFNGTCYESEIVVFNRSAWSSMGNIRNVSLPFHVCGHTAENDSLFLGSNEDMAANDLMASSAYSSSNTNATVQTLPLNVENMTETAHLNRIVNDFIDELSTEQALHVASTTVVYDDYIENDRNFDWDDYNHNTEFEIPSVDENVEDLDEPDSTTKRVFKTTTMTPATTPREVVLRFCIKLCVSSGIGLISKVKMPEENHCINDIMKLVNRDMNHELKVHYTWDVHPYTCFDVPELTPITVEVSQAPGVDSIPFAMDVIGATYPIEHTYRVPQYPKLGRNQFCIRCLASGCSPSSGCDYIIHESNE